MAYKNVVLADKPLAYWRLGERSGTSAVDSGGGGFTGTLTATGVTLGMNGPLADPKDSDTAMLFDGTNGVISASANSFLPAGTNVWSLEVWFKPSAIDASFRRIMGREPAGNHGAFLALNTLGQVYALRGDAAAAFDAITSTVALVAGQWTHLVATYDGSLIRLYQNGALNGSVASSRSVDESTNLMYLGNASAGGATMGVLDEAATYSTVLSPDRVAAHYQAGLANFTAAEHSAACSFHVLSNAGVFLKTLRGVLIDPVLSSKLNEGFAALHLELDHYPTELAFGNLIRVDFPDGTVAGTWKFEQRNEDFKAGGAAYSMDPVPLVAETSDVGFNANYTSDTTQPGSALGAADPRTVSLAAIALTGHLSAGTVTAVGTSYGYLYNNAVVRDALDQHVHFGGAGWWWMVHETGVTDVTNLTNFAHSVTLGREATETNFDENTHSAINVQPVVGATPASGTTPLAFTATDSNPGNPLSTVNFGVRTAKVFTDTSLVTIGDVTAMANSLLGQQERVTYRRTYRLTGYTTHRVRCGDSMKIRAPNADPSTGAYSVIGPLVVQEVVQYGASNVYDIVTTDTAVIFSQRAQESRTNAIDKLIQNQQRTVPVSPDGTTGTISSGALGNAPNTPTGLALGTFIENNAQVENAAITATWSASVVDSTHAAATLYNVRYRRTGTTPWQTASGVIAGTLTATIVNLIQGVSYDVQVSATNAGGDSAWSSTVTQVTAQAGAPAQVGAPSATAGISTIVVSFNLLVASDIQTYEVWQFTGASSASTPPGGSILAHTGNDAIVTIGGLTSATTYTFWVRAENWSGVFGSYSTFVQATTARVQTFDVSQALFSISQAPNPGFEDLTPGGTLPSRWHDGGGNNTALRGTSTPATGSAELDLPCAVSGVGNNSRAYSDAFPVVAGDIWYFSVQARASVATTTGFYYRIGWDNVNNNTSDGNVNQVDIAGNAALTTAYQKFEGKATVPAGATYAHIIFYNYQPNVANTTYVDDVVAIHSIGTQMIQNLAVQTAQIDNLAVTNAKVNDMAVDKLTAGTLTAGVVMAGHIQSAVTVDSTHAGWLSDATSIRFYDGTGTNYGAPSGAGVTIEFKNDGSGFFKGTISASNVYGSTVATASTTGTTGNAGFKLSGQFLDFFTIGATPEGNRYYFAPDAVTAFTLGGELAAASSVFAGPVTKTVLQLTNFVGLEAVTTDNTLGRGLIQTQYSSDGNSSIFAGRKARGSLGAGTTIVNGDEVVALYAQAYDGTNWIAGGLAGFGSNGTVAAGSIPMDFIILTGHSAATLAEVFRVRSNAHWWANGGTAPTLGALQAGIGSQSIAGNDTILNVTITTNAVVGGFSAVASISYGTSWGGAPKHALTVVAPPGNPAPPYIGTDGTATFTISVMNPGLGNASTQNYNVINIGSS